MILVMALVVLAALAVSHVYVLNFRVGRPMRWMALAGLALVAVAYAATRFDQRLLRDRVVWLAAAFPTLALASVFWSSDAALTLARALTLGLLFFAAGAIAVGIGGETRAARRLLFAILASATAVAVGGVIDLAYNPEHALVPATTGSPSRYAGIGGNPNMMAMLLAGCLPLAAWAFLEARSVLGKAFSVLIFVGFDASIVASGSRGALLAGSVGLAAFGLALPIGRRARGLVAVGALALLALNVGLTQLPQPADRNPVLYREFGAPRPRGPGDAQFILPLESELGFPPEGFAAESRPRSLFDTSGRRSAWEGALDQVLERPALGYGFGTEDRVFVDRFYEFYSSTVENSFLGTALQLGVGGLAVLLLLIVALATRGVRTLEALVPPARPVAAACLGVLAAGLVLALTQSYLTSVGNPTTTPVWLSAFLLAMLGAGSAPPRDESPARSQEGKGREGEEQATQGE